MRREDELTKELNLAEQSAIQNERMEEEAREIREAELSDKWKKFMLEQEIEKQQIIQQLTEGAILRGTKGKKKKKKGKGK